MLRWKHALRSLTLLALPLLAVQGEIALAQSCQSEWSGLSTTGPNDKAGEAVVFDDGSGPALFVGGRFTTVGSNSIVGIAKWDGQAWSNVGGVTDVRGLVVFNDGTGDALYAAGLANGQIGVFKWDGQSWSLVGGHGFDGAIEAVISFDDGSGPALYVGGDFRTVSQVGGDSFTAWHIARWNGTSWSTVGSGLGGQYPGVYDLAVFDEGQGAGPQLFACGDFPANGSPSQIAKWDGAFWLPVPHNLDAGSHLYSMAVFNDGNGPALYAGGMYTGNGQYGILYRWDGISWTTVAAGTDFGDSAADNEERWVESLFTFDDGTGGGPALYVGGAFPIVSGVAVTNIAKWNGQSWSAVGNGVGTWDGNPRIWRLTAFNGTLIALGQFSTASGLPVTNSARFACDPVGACCLTSGACAARTEPSCSADNGTYAGDDTACETAPACVPAPTGACCINGGCSVVYDLGPGGCESQLGLYQGDSVACSSVNCGDLEPNDSKQQANMRTLASGDSIQGFAIGSDVDYFLIQTHTAPLGIYQQRMTLANPTTPGNTATIRGASQVSNASGSGPWPCDVGTINTNPFDDPGVQDSVILATNTATNTWYGFGKGERVYYRVAGRTTTTGLYTATLQTTPVSPTNLGPFHAGTITISTTGQGYTYDTGLRVYDANLDPIPGYSNDNQSANGGGANSGNTSFLQRDYTPGTYYLGLSVSALACNIGAPCDDRKRNGPMMDLPDIAVDANPASTATNVPFSITDSLGTTLVPVTRGQQEISWFEFTVVGSGVCCRGATCNSTVTQSSCTGNSLAGAFFADAGACNATGNTATPCCYPDYDKMNGVQVGDIFAFLNDWFAGSKFAIPGGDGETGTLSVQNIFDFLNAWFAGGC
jgi:hypothetical protein